MHFYEFTITEHCYRLFCCRQLDAQVNNGLYLIRREFDSPSDSQIQYKKRHARLKNGKSSTTRSHAVATITTTILIQYTFDSQDNDSRGRQSKVGDCVLCGCYSTFLILSLFDSLFCALSNKHLTSHDGLNQYALMSATKGE
ncbi:hypothetical protein T07_10683, partial [Trichinella nelsoni]